MKFHIFRASSALDQYHGTRHVSHAGSAARHSFHVRLWPGAGEQGGKSILAVLEHADGTLMVQPFIKRATPYDETKFDLCSPYGYGGPIVRQPRL